MPTPLQPTLACALWEPGVRRKQQVYVRAGDPGGAAEGAEVWGLWDAMNKVDLEKAQRPPSRQQWGLVPLYGPPCAAGSPVPLTPLPQG